MHLQSFSFPVCNPRSRIPKTAIWCHDRSCMLLQALSGCLIRLAVQHCNIVDVSPLTALQQLQNLNLAGNEVQHVASIQGLIGSCPGLHTLDVRDNPLCSMRSYRQAFSLHVMFMLRSLTSSSTYLPNCLLACLMTCPLLAIFGIFVPDSCTGLHA